MPQCASACSANRLRCKSHVESRHIWKRYQCLSTAILRRRKEKRNNSASGVVASNKEHNASYSTSSDRLMARSWTLWVTDATQNQSPARRQQADVDRNWVRSRKINKQTTARSIGERMLCAIIQRRFLYKLNRCRSLGQP